ncbi:MAG: bifunctional phosphoglucose/phosphomannose isomerase [Bacillota bacterium]|nr:bifunctional phosphoglucose/phosphomannose isomerase [Bacillota bacterium]
MHILDDPSARRRLDPQGTESVLAGLADQLEEAARLADAAELPSWREIAAVVVAGMGGSAIGGDLVRGLVAPKLTIPFYINREYELPAWVDRRVLVIASSYSGNTAETLAAYREAKRRGARVVAISTGGELELLAQEAGDPWIKIPGGISPRAAVGFSLVPILLVLERLGLVAPRREELKEAQQVLLALREEVGAEAPLEQNPAKQLALSLHGRLPVVYGGEGWRAVVAYRWKTQLNENAKHLAYWHALPELNHNETVGWEFPPDLARQVHLVFLRDRLDSEPIRRRFEVTAEIAGPRVHGITEVWSRGESDLARLFALLYFGDWTSYHLAILNGVDPTPVRVIDYLKARLAGR